MPYICGRPELSECRKYRLDSDPLISTSLKSDKIFQYAGGTISAANEIKQLPFEVREEAKAVHMIQGTQNNLLSTNQFSKAKYITIFDKDKVNIYDATNTEIKTTRGTVLREWCIFDEGMWRIPLDENETGQGQILTQKPSNPKNHRPT